ncbi:MAG: hypothetical protein Q9195_005529 [Heterodermia aff. obscurata]
MSFSSETAPNGDHTSVPYQSRDKPEDSHVTSLTTLAGRYLVNEAHAFFEELQADLSSIKIQGNGVDELWCTLDWQRYILGLWVKKTKEGSCMCTRKWLEIKETWETIVHTTVSLNLRYALPSSQQQRPVYNANTRSLTFGKVLYGDWYDSFLAEDEKSLMKAILQATEEAAWTTPLFHERVFTGLIESAVEDLAITHLSAQDQEKRRSGIESCEFKVYIEALEKQIKMLISLSPAEEQEEIYMALDRALRTALLESNVGTNIGYLQFYHSLVSAWPFNNDTLALEIESIFQERVQEIFGKIISRPYDSSRPQAFPYTVQDLENILALGADIRGEVKGRQNCALWTAAKSNNCQFFKALAHAGAPYTMEPRLECFPLQGAAEVGNLDIVEFLLDSKRHCFEIDINHESRLGRTALHEEAANCHESVIDVLLQQPGIDANPENYGGFTPFLLAVSADANRRKKYASVKIFLGSKIVNHNRMLRDSANALHLAARSRDATLKIIIRHINCIDAEDECGETPLHYAVESSSRPNVGILLANGADPTIADELGVTPLVLACSRHHLGPMELLLSLPESLKYQCPEPLLGFQPNVHPSNAHCSPVTLVLRGYDYASKGKRAHIGLALSIILAAKPDLEMRNEIAGADVNSQDNDRRTPLHRLMDGPSPSAEKVGLLLEWGADMGVEDKDGEAAVPADWNGLGKKLLEVVKKHKKVQQQKNLSVLAKQTAAYVKDQKQRKTQRNRPSNSNPFAILPVEGMDSIDPDLGTDTSNSTNN